MSGRAPDFWWSAPGAAAAALAPGAALYGLAASRRMANAKRASASLAVICVGNFTVGGGGKTPTALALARDAYAAGRRPGFLTRGHGGSLSHPALVDMARHGAVEVGDEPLLLAGSAPTAVARDRAQGAELLFAAGCDLAIMDDGFQSATLGADYTVIVVDGHRGLGNERVLPAGPLRAPFAVQVAYADLVLVVGEGAAGCAAADQSIAAGRRVARASLVARPVEATGPLLAFAGIADPAKFFRTLEALGLHAVEKLGYPDHAVLTDGEADEIRLRAASHGLVPATTRKDMVRLDPRRPAHRALAQACIVVDVDLAFAEPAEGGRIVRAAVDAFEARH